MIASSVDPNKTLNDLVGRSDSEAREKIKSDPAYLEIMSRISAVLEIADEYNLPHGDVLVMINKTFGLTWHSIPLHRFPEIESYLRRNWFRSTQIMTPHIHLSMMENDNDYSQWFRTLEAQHKEVSNGIF